MEQEPEPQVPVEEEIRSPQSPFLSKTIIRLPEQPSRDEVARRRGADQLTAGRVLAELSTPAISRFVVRTSV